MGSIRRFILSAGLLLAMHCAAARSPAESPRLALSVLEKYDDAWLHKDVAGFEALLSPTYVYFTSNGAVIDRAAIVAMLASPKYSIDSGSRDELETHAHGDIVVVSTRWRGRGSYADKAFVDDQRCSVVVALKPKPAVLAEHCTNL
ncbi:MAG TPA: nuclear transport factor 2 family protein [Thermoanaerobaculia bacterium]|nr:nuclear transport factor 2 family protein [Thermoanaerobaculia bacterium]